ncbi:MarR family transcriptional regulator [Marinomonas agarivorans]|nr:MarR family transcriptional regulator [Marinomonas agarivorans]
MNTPDDIKDRNVEAIAEKRASHLGRYVYEINKEFKRLSVPYIQNNGFDSFTEGQLQVLAELNLTCPTPLKKLYQKEGISKQAISRMVSTCEKNGYIRRTTSADDKRSIDVVFTERGQALMAVAAQAIDHAEKHFIAKLGEHQFMVLKKCLSETCDRMGVIDVS